MSEANARPQGAPITRQGHSVLNHPDQRSAWVLAAAATLDQPVADVDDRLVALAESLPLTASRLGGDQWAPHPPLAPLITDGDPLDDPRLLARFELRAAPPWRVVIGQDGTKVGVAAHHAALDGLGLAAVLRALVDGTMPVPAVPAPPGVAGSSGRKLGLPADRIAASRPSPSRESLVARDIRISGTHPTARIAAACVAAAADHNSRAGRPWRRVGLSLGVGGPPGAGNVATYRRIDLPANEDFVAATQAALDDQAEPAELSRTPRLGWALVPILSWFSDSMLVSNLGRLEMDGATSIEFFPVARGRSAVAFGAAGLAGGRSTLTIRARDINVDASTRLLEGAIERFTASS